MPAVGSLYEPSADDAEEWDFTGDDVEDSVVFTTYVPAIADAGHVPYKVQNELLALRKAALSGKQYQKVFTCGVGDAIGSAVYLSADDTVATAKADTAPHSKAFGFIIYKPTTTSCIVIHYYLAVVAGASFGDTIYLQDDGSFDITPGTVSVAIGFALNATHAHLFLGPTSPFNNVGFIKADGTVPFTGDQSLGSHKLTNVTDPTSAQDAATLNALRTLIDDPINGYVLLDDFTGGGAVGLLASDNFGSGPFNLQDQSSGTAAGVVNINGNDASYGNAVGVVAIQTGSTNAGAPSIFPVGKTINLTNFAFSTEYRIKIPVLSAGGDRFTTYFGLWGDNGNATLLFRQVDNVNSGKWQAVASKGGTETATDTTVVAVADTWVTFKIVVNAAGTSVTYYINGTLVATITTNLPNDKPLFPVMLEADKSAGTTAMYVYWDFARMVIGATGR